MGMLFAEISDIHLTMDKPIARTDAFQQTQTRKFLWVLNWAKENGAFLLCAGDLFDTPRSWRALSFYISLIRKYEVPFFSVFGQHDDYLYNENSRRNTALGVLIEAGLVKLLSPTGTQIGANIIYGCSYGEEIPKDVKSSVGLPETGKKILIIHKNISDTEKNIFETTSALIFLRKNTYFDVIFCGDIHKTFMIEHAGRFICNSGPLVRMEASADMFDHHPGFWTYDTEKRNPTWVEIPHLPADKVLTREHIEEVERTDELLNQFIEGIERPDEQETSLSFKDNMLLFIAANDLSDGIKFILSKTMGGIE